MAATSRRSRNYKEKNSMFAFGHFALPIAALVAVGLLFVGIKLFFLTPSGKGDGIEVPIDGTEGPGYYAAVSFDEFAETPPDLIFETLPEETASKPSSAPAVGPIGSQTEAASAAKASQPSAPARQDAKAKAPVRRTPAPSTAQAPSGTGWAVQVGAFSKLDGANTVLAEMKKMGYVASVSKSEASGSTFHRVRVSAGKSREEAQRLASQLEKKGYPVLVVPAR
ncbi:MAG: SPOR domain-containing protein [Synergistaceae bacterium]|nr:SPOR domain-containing protein [Synergistaceae bacterium]